MIKNKEASYAKCSIYLLRKAAVDTKHVVPSVIWGRNNDAESD